MRGCGVVVAACAVLAAAPSGPGAGSGVVRAVPTPPAGQSVVTVRTGGDRTGNQAVGPLPGVRLGLYASEGAAEPVDPVWGECVSDAQGDCSFTVPGTGTGGVNAGRRLWVRQLPGGAPGGWFTNPELRVGPGSGSGSIAAPYTFETPALAEGRTYSSTATGPDGFMLSSSYGANYAASGGVWQDSRTNPVPTVGCGLDVAVLLDLSASVGSALPQLKDATDAFTDALTGTPSRMALFSFDKASPASSVGVNYPHLQPVSTKTGADAFKARYADWTLGKGTNWDQGLWAVARAPEHYDALVVITDGNPTRFADNAQGDGSNTHFRDVENGIFSANSVKAKGTRVIALGVGKGVSGVSGLNLRAISGPTLYNGANLAAADYFQTADFEQAGRDLHNLALSRCDGSISVVKQIVPADTEGEDTTGAVNAGAGWTFRATTQTPGIGGLPASETTDDDGTGAVAFRPAFVSAGRARITVTEQQHPDFEAVTPGGRHAVCTDLATGHPVAAADTGDAAAPGFALDLGSTDAVSCLVYNRPVEAADVAVAKTWRINGEDYPEGRQPKGFEATLTLTGPHGDGASTQPFGRPRSGYRVGGHTTVAETTRLTEPGCVLESARITELNGHTADFPLPRRVGLDRRHVRATVTNVVRCGRGAPTTAPPTSRPGGDTLPQTGAAGVLTWLAAGLTSLVLGGSALLAARRRPRR